MKFALKLSVKVAVVALTFAGALAEAGQDTRGGLGVQIGNQLIPVEMALLNGGVTSYIGLEKLPRAVTGPSGQVANYSELTENWLQYFQRLSPDQGRAVRAAAEHIRFVIVKWPLVQLPDQLPHADIAFPSYKVMAKFRGATSDQRPTVYISIPNLDQMTDANDESGRRMTTKAENIGFTIFHELLNSNYEPSGFSATRIAELGKAIVQTYISRRINLLEFGLANVVDGGIFLSDVNVNVKTKIQVISLASKDKNLRSGPIEAGAFQKYIFDIVKHEDLLMGRKQLSDVVVTAVDLINVIHTLDTLRTAVSISWDKSDAKTDYRALMDSILNPTEVLKVVESITPSDEFRNLMYETSQRAMYGPRDYQDHLSVCRNTAACQILQVLVNKTARELAKIEKMDWLRAETPEYAASVGQLWTCQVMVQMQELAGALELMKAAPSYIEKVGWLTAIDREYDGRCAIRHDETKDPVTDIKEKRPAILCGDRTFSIDILSKIYEGRGKKRVSCAGKADRFMLDAMVPNELRAAVARLQSIDKEAFRTEAEIIVNTFDSEKAKTLQAVKESLGLSTDIDFKDTIKRIESFLSDRAASKSQGKHIIAYLDRKKIEGELRIFDIAPVASDKNAVPAKYVLRFKTDKELSIGGSKLELWKMTDEGKMKKVTLSSAGIELVQSLPYLSIGIQAPSSFIVVSRN